MAEPSVPALPGVGHASIQNSPIHRESYLYARGIVAVVCATLELPEDRTDHFFHFQLPVHAESRTPVGVIERVAGGSRSKCTIIEGL
jgi:hypothetical protein